MLIEIKIPPLSESVATATLLAWEKHPGDAVRRNEVLLSIETDKIVLDIPSPVEGVLFDILRREGDSVPAGEVIARVDTSAVPSAAARPPAALAASAPLPLPQEVLPERQERRVALSPLRQKLAQRMLQSQQQSATLTTFNEVNMAPVMELRREHRAAFEKEYGVKLGFMSFFVKAVVGALRAYPLLNASLAAGEIVYHDYYDIGIAVGSARGLVVPVLRDAERLSLAQIEQKIADFSARAGDGRLGIEELSGGTFSISNGGVFGSMLSTPILNPPQAAILGIHATKDRPVVENGEIVIRPINYLALSYDHRLIDGREAVQCLVAIKSALENPLALFAE